MTVNFIKAEINCVIEMRLKQRWQKQWKEERVG